MFAVLTFVLCNPTGEALPLEGQGKRGTASIQSAPQAKPEPWKWDLWGS